MILSLYLRKPNFRPAMNSVMDGLQPASGEGTVTILEAPRETRRVDAVTLVSDDLRNGILGGRYVPGQRLIEADLTRHFGVSRGPLREAFHRLAAEGLLEIVPNRGAIVRRLSRRETRELFEIRIELEALAAGLAAERALDPQVRETFAEKTAVIWEDRVRLYGRGYLEENAIFHMAIFEAADNHQLRDLCVRLRFPLLMLQLTSSMGPEIHMRSLGEHREIALGILDADRPRAAEAMRRHLQIAAEVSMGMPDDIFR